MIYDLKLAEKTADFLLSIDAVTFRFAPPYTYTTGMKSPIYLDNRLVMSYPEIRNKIIANYIAVLKNKVGLSSIDIISATATAAIPQGAWIADRLNLPMVFVRPSTKMHGKGSKVEGYFKKNSKVVIIEDHISTAESVVGNAASIRELGGIVKYCIATTTYETKISEEKLKANKIQLIALTTGKIILDRAFKNKQLKEREKDLVDLWFKDPPNWENL